MPVRRKATTAELSGAARLVNKGRQLISPRIYEPHSVKEITMSNPAVIGRYAGTENDVRASTELVSSTSVLIGLAGGDTMTCECFRSTDCEDRGGVVFRVSLDKDNPSFLPFAKNIEGGIELHMAGDIEARSLVAALKGALDTLCSSSNGEEFRVALG